MARKEPECPPCEEGAPAWMVTYGDMVTLLLCLFVMLFTTGKATPQEVQIILSAFNNSLGFFTGGQTLSKGRMEEMGMNLESLPSQTQGRSLSRAKQQAVSVFVPEIRARKVRVTEDERGLVISLVGEDYFARGSAELTPSVRDVLRRAAPLISELGNFVRVEGYASLGEEEFLRPGSAPDEERVYENTWDLAGARAINSTNFLMNHGVPAAWMQAVSFGQYRPLDVVPEGTPEGAAHNRRIDIVIMTYKKVERGSDESGYNLGDVLSPQSEETVPDN